MKSLIKIILGLFAIIVVINIYVWLPIYLEQDEKAGKKLSEVYADIGKNYEIGTHYGVNKICNKDKNIGCLNGELKGLKKVNGYIYIYVYVYISEVTKTDINGKSNISGYFYDLFINEQNNYIKNKKDIPKFGYLSNDELIFYSENDLKNLSQEMQDIFKELEKNPKIIIDGIQYN